MKDLHLWIRRVSRGSKVRFAVTSCRSARNNRYSHCCRETEGIVQIWSDNELIPVTLQRTYKTSIFIQSHLNLLYMLVGTSVSSLNIYASSFLDIVLLNCTPTPNLSFW